MKSTSGRSVFSAVLAVLCGLVSAPLFAGPTGGQVVAGTATLSSGDGSLTVTQTSGRAIINWQDFSIGAGEFARFIQPDAASATLNRVVSGLPSNLEGSLQANGQVYLINPNGVIIGSGARIDTAGFLASTLDIADAEFLAGGDLHFSGASTAAIENLGAINALGGDVFLIARQVQNSGSINAANGTAGLAAGSEILLTAGGDERLFVQAASLAGTVVNSGSIAAATAELKAAGGNAYALAINNTGLVRATGSATRNGAIWLVSTGDSTVADSGTLDASSATGQGGKIVVTGSQVLLDNGAQVDASGATGGGEVDVGGGWQGNDTAIANASAVVMQPTATIDVSATASGSGGTAVLWSQDYTGFYGSIAARGGPGWGDGGQVETSSANNLQVSGLVDTSAVNGAAGNWLLDPFNVTIASSGASGTAFANPFTPAGNSVILASSVATALNSGANVTISTGSSGGSTGDITVSAPVSWTANSVLTLSAFHNIALNASLSATGATAGLVLTPNTGSGGGTYSLGNGVSVTLSGATPSLTIGGIVYTVINSVGVAGDATSTTLQGMKNALSGHYALGSDIDAMATSGWNGGLGFAPIGTTGFAFTGTFEGFGHAICDLTINRPTTDYNGLFGYISGSTTIQNVGLTTPSITGHFYNGALVGYNNGGTIANSYATGGSVAGNEESGGLLAANYSGGTVSNSYATDTVSTTVSGLVGGLVADNNGTISNSWASGSVSGNNNAGGLAGTSGGTISNSYATGSVSGPSVSIGGLAGGNNGTISNSYATGTVNGNGTGDEVGGLVGYNIGGISNSYATGSVSNASDIGGLVGENGNSNGTVATSYSTGLVTSTGTAIGGLVGSNNGTVTGSYWNGQVNGATAGIGGGTLTGATGLTTAQMHTASSFTAFTFSTTPGAPGSNSWVLVDDNSTLNNALGVTGATYPMLTSEYSTVINGDHQLQLMEMALSASYTLRTDIAALSTGNSTDVWTSQGFIPVGNNVNFFAGSFDGLGHIISGFTINRPSTSFVGLFGELANGAVIQNVGMFGGSVTGSTEVGGLVGYNGKGTINTSYATDTVTGGTTDVGGLVGNNSGTISNSYASGNVTGTGGTVGGLAGSNSDTIIDTYATGSVTGVGAPTIGGLLGNNSGSVTNSYWKTSVKATGIGGGTTTGATGLSDAQIEQQASFNTWDFSNTWVIYNGFTTPFLRVFMKTLTVTAADTSKTYDGLAFSGGTSVTYTPCPDVSLILGTLGYGGTSQGAINAGTYAITPTGLYSNQQGYIITVVPGTLTVNKANLTLGGTRIYDGTALFAGLNLTATGVHSESFTVTGSGDVTNLGANKNVQTNVALSSITGLAVGTGNSGAALASNYNNLSVTGSVVSVTPANLNLVGTKAYDGTTAFAGSLLTADGVDGETFSLTGSAVLGTKNVQSNQSLGGFGGLALGSSSNGGIASNYKPLSPAVTGSSVSVTPASLTLSGTEVYNGATVFAGVGLTATGVNGETFTVTGAGASGDLTTKNVQTNQLLASVTGLSLGTSGNGGLSGNYSALSITGSSVSVTPASLILSGTRVYNGATVFAGANLTATGVNGETFSVTGAGASGNLTTKNVQTNQALASLTGLSLGTSGNGGVSSNYNALSVTGSSVSVTPAALTLSGTEVYNGTTVFAGAGLTATGVNGETFTVTGAGASGDLTTKNVQTNQLLASVAGLALGTSGNGGLSSNYSVLSVPGSSVSVTPANLILSGSQVYNGATVFAGAGLTATGVNGETFTVTGAGASGDLTTKNVQTNQLLASLSGLSLGTSSNGGLASNYNALSLTASSVSVTPANLILSGTQVYNGATVFAGANLTATGVDGETFAVTGAGASGNLTTRNVQTNQLLASTTGLSLGTSGNGGLASNYNALSLTASSVSVTPAPLTVTTSDVVKTYDGGTLAAGSPVITVGQLFGSDALTFSPFSPTYSFVGKDVGIGNKTVTVTGIGVNDGNSGHNYTVTLANNTTSTINPANLTLSGTEIYNGTTVFAGAGLTATGVNGETFTVTGAGASGDLTTKNVQANQLLASVAGLSVGTSGNGGLSSDYNALSVTGSSVSVTPANLILSGTQVYNGGTAFAGANLTATGVNGETFVLTGAGTAGDLSTKNVQTNQALVSLSGLALGTSGNGGLSSNYNVLSVTGSSVSVTPAALTLSGTQVYNGTTVFAGANLTATGVNGETFSVTGAGASGDLTTKNVQTNQALATVAGLALGTSGNGGLATNYNVLSVTGSSVSVTPATLTLGGTMVYNGTTVFAGSNLTATGVNGETFTVTGGGASGDLTTKNVQTNQLLASLTGLSLGTSSNGGLSSNYNALSVTGSSVSVTPANLILSGTQVYNGTTVFAGGNLTATGANGETFTVTGAGASGDLTTKNVQTSQLLASVAGLALGTSGNGGLSSNYNALSVTGSSVSVTPATLTLSGTQVYNGGTAFAGGNLTATGVAGETFSVTGAGASGNLTTKNVQSGQLLANLTGLALGTSSNGGLSSNYNALSVTGSSVSVTPANLILSGTQVYSGTTVFAGANLTATGVNGETFTVTGAGASGDLSTKNVQTNQLLASVAGLSLGIGNSGAAVSSNYTAMTATGSSVSVTPATLTLSGTMVYNGTTAFAGSNLTATGVNGETFAVTGAGATGNLSVKDVQTGQLLTSVGGLAVGNGNTGAAISTNYNALATTGSSVSVTAAPLTITANNQTRAANVANPTLTATYTGLVPSDTSSVVTGLTLVTTAVLASPVGSYPITGSGASALDYAITYVPGTLVVGQSALLISANNQSKIYGAALPAFSASYATFVNGDTAAVVTGLQFSTTASASSNVGTYTITPFGASAPSYYVISYAPGTLTINPASLTISANSASRLYGASNPSFGANYVGLVNGDSSSVVSGLTITTGATAASNVGSYVITPSGGSAQNYSISFSPGTLSVTPAPLTITADNKSRGLNVANPVLTASYSGFVNGDTSTTVSGLTLATTAAVSSPAGSYPITASGATASNYAIAYVPGQLVIGQNLLTITATNESMTYGTALPAFAATYAGLVNGDTSAVVTGLQFGTTASVGSNVGTYTITPFGATAANYLLAYVPGILTINPAALTISANNATRLYGAGNPTFGATYVGLVNGDTSAVVTGLSITSVATASSNVGSYAITPFAAAAANYTITYVPGSLTVSPAPLTISASSASRLYGAVNPNFGATYSGFVNGDSSAVVTGLAITSAATAASNVGSYAITPFAAAAANYTITYVPGSLTVNPAPLTISASSASRQYGAVNPTFGATYSGFVNGDTSAVVTGLAVTSAATAASNVGNYAITPFAAAAANYTIAYIPGSLTINPAPLTIAATSASRLYGGANPAFGATYSGFVNGDTSSVVTGLTLTSAATASSNVGTYAITPFAAAAANYTIAYIPGSLTVNPAPLAITANSATRLYGGANPAFAATYSGFVNGDTSAVVTGLTITSAATVASNVGSYAITPFAAAAANYTISYVPGSLTVNPAPLTVAAANATRAFGAPNPTFTATITGFVNGDSTAVVSGLTLSTPAVTTSPAGSYSIVPSGAKATNYTLTFVPGTLLIAAPTVTVGPTSEPIDTISQQPVQTTTLVVVVVDGNPVLVPVVGQGSAVVGTGGTSPSLDQSLTLILDATAARPTFLSGSGITSGSSLAGFASLGGINFGEFELVSSLAGDVVLGGAGSSLASAQQNDPGLFRESTVNMGGFNVIYHEPLAEANQQSRTNTALGSSYREFSDSDNPQVNVVHSKIERKPGTTTSGETTSGTF